MTDQGRNTNVRNTWRLVGAALLVLTACGGGKATAPPTPPTTAALPSLPDGSSVAAIQARGKLVVGVKFDQPGLGQRNPVTGVIEGFDVEVAKLVAAGIFGDSEGRLDLREVRSADRESAIETGAVDVVIASYTVNEARQKRVDFAGPYLVAHQDVLVRLDDEVVSGPTDLNGRRVCTARGSTSAGNLQAAAPSAVVVLADAYGPCVDMLRRGEVDAVTTDGAILAGFVATYPTELKVVGSSFSDEPYGIGLQRGDAALRAFVNERLAAAAADGTWVEAFESTLGRIGLETPPAPPLNP